MRKKKLDPSRISEAIQFSEQLSDPHLWVRKSDELLAAASLVESEIQKQWSEVELEDGRVVRTSGRTNVQGPYFLLVAYAVENSLKGVLVHRNRESLRNRLPPSLPSYLTDHDLIKLAKRVQFKASLQEEDLLIRLSRNSVWAGRYPVPTGPDRTRAVEQFSDGRVYLTAYFAPSDVDRLRALLDRLRSFVLAEIAKSAA